MDCDTVSRGEGRPFIPPAELGGILAYFDKGLVKEEEITMWPFYAEGDSNLGSKIAPRIPRPINYWIELYTFWRVLSTIEYRKKLPRQLKKGTYLNSSLFLKFPEVSFRANNNLQFRMLSESKDL